MQALQRILAILESVAAQPTAASASAVADQVGLSLSTTARLMNQMTAEQVLIRSSDGLYTIGPRLVHVARAGTDRFDLRALAKPTLAELRDSTGETTGLHIRSGNQRICIASASSSHAVSRVVPIGLSLPLPGSATGEVLLSGASDDTLALLTADMPERKRRALTKRLDTIRERGWALISDTFVEGVTGIAAAVKDPDGSVVAAISCSGPSHRFTGQIAEGHIPDILQAADELSDLHRRSL